MDCEMVGIGENGSLSALARVSIINWDGDILLDTYVKVSQPVTDLRSNISGIMKNHIDGSLPKTMDFDEAVHSVQNIISGKILIGHGLKNDLRVLNISHPWQDIRDTTKYEPFMKKDANNLLIPRKLKDLSLEKLRVKIQEEGKPHCSVSDAVAAMQLYHKASKQWEKVIEYKVKKTQEILSMKVKDREK
jgi:RNA exonuclease 4